MNRLEAITTLLGDKELEALDFFVKKAQEGGSQHLAWHDKGQKLLEMADCDVKFHRTEFARRHPALEALASLQFVSFRKTGDTRIPEQYHLTLYPAAIHRVQHEQRGRLGRWWEIRRLRYQDAMTVIAFVLSTILTMAKIYELIY